MIEEIENVRERGVRISKEQEDWLIEQYRKLTEAIAQHKADCYNPNLGLGRRYASRKALFEVLKND